MRFRHPAIVALLLAVLLPRIAFPQSRPNLVPNGSFEDALASWQCSVNDPKQVGAAVNLDSSRTREGNRSLKIQLAGPGSATATSPLAPVQAGQDYLLTFWYRSEGFSDTGLFAGVNLQYVLDWLDTDKKPVGTGGMGLSYGAVAEWRFMVSLLTAPPSAAWARIRFPMSVDETGRPSICWLGDLKLRPWLGQPKQGGKIWRFTVAEGAFQQQLFRRVADDDTATGFAVLANPRFNRNPGYLAGSLYTRVLPPGQYRAVFRLKQGQLPAQPQAILNWDINTDKIGYLAAGTISTSAFKQAGVYQNVAVRFVLPPGVAWIDPRLTWNGGVATSHRYDYHPRREDFHPARPQHPHGESGASHPIPRYSFWDHGHHLNCSPSYCQLLRRH